MSDAFAIGHDLPDELVEEMHEKHPELFEMQMPDESVEVTGPTHALQMGGSLSDMKTKCGLALNDPSAAHHGIAFNVAAATCIPCSAVVAAEQKLAAYERGPVPDVLKKYYEWALGPDSGISSKTIVETLTGAPLMSRHFSPSPPRDPADFGRCSRMLALFPELRSRLPEVAAKHGGDWVALVEHWDELEGLLAEAVGGKAAALYARMRELRGEKP